MLKIIKRSVITLTVIILILFISIFYFRKDITKISLGYFIKYKVNNTLFKKSPWKVAKLDISKWSSHEINNQKKEKTLPEHINDINIIAPIMILKRVNHNQDQDNQSPNNQNKNHKPKQIILSNINFSSKLKYPLKNFKQKFNLTADSVYFDSKELRESPVLVFARNIITEKGIRIKGLEISGICNTKAHICNFNHIKLGKKNLIISGTGEYQYKKASGNFDLLLSFTNIKKLKLHLNIRIIKNHMITKLQHLSFKKLLRMF